MELNCKYIKEHPEILGPIGVLVMTIALLIVVVRGMFT